MTNPQNYKEQLGNATEQLENKVRELTPYYTKLEPWQRGLILLALTFLLSLTIYYLTRPEPNLNTKKEAQVEEKILRQMAFFKRLRE